VGETGPDPTGRFTARAESYERGRPGYPIALREFCRSSLGLLPKHIVADVGSGTGILSDLFLTGGNRVMAIEPNDDMRAAAERRFGGNNNFVSIKGRAEETGLADRSVDFILAGQAFHWFDRAAAKIEFLRILRAGGWVILVWNDRRADGEFEAEYESILREFAIDLSEVSLRRRAATHEEDLGDFFSPHGFQTSCFSNSRSFDLEELISMASSASYLPLPGHPRYPELAVRVQKAFQTSAQNGRVWQKYDTRAYYGRLKYV
jgi:SAM-dependent methyltransferase